MAKIILGGIVSAITGSIGGSTYQRHGQTHTIRKKPTSRKFQSPYQNRISQINSEVLTLWQTMAADARSDWSSYALYRGKIKHKAFPKSQSGFELFRSINFYRAFYGITLLDYPTTLGYDIPRLYVDHVYGTPNYEIETDLNIDNTTALLIIKLSSPLKATQNTPRSQLKLLPIATPNSNIISYATEYQARFGILPAIGQRIFYSISFMSLVSGFMYGFDTQAIEVE